MCYVCKLHTKFKDLVQKMLTTPLVDFNFNYILVGMLA